uniref:Uncharacterized protein n=1 Tax=Onchocerca volvulus TaxID=6282 RepID=A0A8R1XSE9_ONCVO
MNKLSNNIVSKSEKVKERVKERKISSMKLHLSDEEESKLIRPFGGKLKNKAATTAVAAMWLRRWRRRRFSGAFLSRKMRKKAISTIGHIVLVT